MRSTSRFSQRIGAAVMIASSFALSTPAMAECLSIQTFGYDEWRVGGEARSRFQINEKIVICVRASRDVVISIWDTPPSGDYERIFPNRLTHANHVGVASGPLSAGVEQCYGTPKTFPMFIPSQDGRGGGKIAVIATLSAEDQFSEDDFAVPGSKVLRSTAEAHVADFGTGEVCRDNMTTVVRYSVGD